MDITSKGNYISVTKIYVHSPACYSDTHHNNSPWYSSMGKWIKKMYVYTQWDNIQP